jgi:hypothetical protein
MSCGNPLLGIIPLSSISRCLISLPKYAVKYKNHTPPTVHHDRQFGNRERKVGEELSSTDVSLTVFCSMSDNFDFAACKTIWGKQYPGWKMVMTKTAMVIIL